MRKFPHTVFINSPEGIEKFTFLCYNQFDILEFDGGIIMSNNKHDKKSMAILALPIGVSLGISIGMMCGSVAGNIPMGLCFGVMGGSIIGLLGFIILNSFSKKKDK